MSEKAKELSPEKTLDNKGIPFRKDNTYSFTDKTAKYNTKGMWHFFQTMQRSITENPLNKK